ncbi:e3 ubiquitin-protein ligase hectd1, partial [Chrysochromulina tobinii]
VHPVTHPLSAQRKDVHRFSAQRKEPVTGSNEQAVQRARARRTLERESRPTLSRRHSTRRHHRAEQMGSGSSKFVMGKGVYKAAWDGNEAELRRLIGLGWSVNWHNPESEAIEVNATDDIGRSALHWAADFGRLAIAKRLLERGADLTLRNRDLYGKTALDDARKQGKSEVVALLSGPRAPPFHALHIWRRVQYDRILRAMVGTSGVDGGLAAWFASLIVAETGRAGCATDSGTPTRARALRRALGRSLAH